MFAFLGGGDATVNMLNGTVLESKAINFAVGNFKVGGEFDTKCEKSSRKSVSLKWQKRV